MSKRSSPAPMVIEITVISAEGIKTKSSGPFITLSTSWQPATPLHVYRTCPDDRSGGMTLTWGDKFMIPFSDNVLLHPSNHYFHIRLFGNGLFMGKKQLGWCQIPVNDVIDRSGMVRRLSYRLRNKDGSRGDGIVNIGVKWEGSFPDVVNPQRRQKITPVEFPVMGIGGGTVVGIPLGLPPTGFRQDGGVGFGYRWEMRQEEYF